jgi:hypothetical protein
VNITRTDVVNAAFTRLLDRVEQRLDRSTRAVG